MAVEWKENPRAKSHVPTQEALLFAGHIGGRLREEAVFSFVASKRSDGRMATRQLVKSYVENGSSVLHIQYVGNRWIFEKEFPLSKGWKSDKPPTRVQFTITDNSGELGPIVPSVKIFRPGSEFHLKYLITSQFFDVIIIECIGDTLDESDQKNFHYRQLARELLVAARGNRVTLITVNETRESFLDASPAEMPQKNWAKGVSPYAEKLTDECLFIGNSGGDDSPQWLSNPVRGTKALVWADKSAGVFRSVGQLDDYYEIDGDSFTLTEKARQLGLLSCADVAGHIELEPSNMRKEVA